MKKQFDLEALKAIEEVSENVKKLNCTQIIVAHRLSTISECDEIVLLKDGKIEDVGRHEYLLTNSSYYKALYKINNHKEVEIC